jgi:hypothetical protein
MVKWPLAALVIGAIAVATWRSLREMGVGAYPWYAGAALLGSLLVLLIPTRRTAPGLAAPDSSNSANLVNPPPSSRIGSLQPKDGATELANAKSRAERFRSQPGTAPLPRGKRARAMPPSVATQAMNRHADGDDPAFEALFDAVAPQLRLHLGAHGRDSARVEELIHRTMLELHKTRGGFLRGADVLPWAMALAAALRSKGRENN